MPCNNNIYCKLLYGIYSIIYCRESWNKVKEGTRQGDQTAVGAYALGVSHLIHFLSNFIFINEHRNEVAFVNDSTVAGKVSEIKTYYDILK